MSNPKNKKMEWPTMLVPMPVQIQWEPGQTSGVMHMTIEDVGGEVIDGDGKRLGDLHGCIGGGMEINITEEGDGRRYTYYMPTMEIWKAVYAEHHRRLAAKRDAERADIDEVIAAERDLD